MAMQSPHERKSGQAMLFLIMVVVLGVTVVLWNFDFHRAVTLKMKARDAGDAAALASARWQGISLNTIGELNLIKASLVTTFLESGGGDPSEIISELIAINGLQDRVMIDGPMVAFTAAQQAAFNNGIHPYAGYHFYVKPMGSDPFWVAQENFLKSIVNNGIAAQLVNSRAGDHPLMDPNFYAAIEQAKKSGKWCLFYQYPELKTYLEGYTNPEDYWPDKTENFDDLPTLGVYYIPPGETNTYNGTIGSLIDTGSATGNEGELQSVVNNETAGRNLPIDIALIEDFPWYPVLYNQTKWNRSWNDYIDEHELPFRRSVKDRYNYMWGQNIYQLHLGYSQLTPGLGYDTMDWVSAAKVFGYLEGSGGDYPPQYFGMVLPAFRDVRLIPVPPDVRSPDLEEHFNEHIDDYLAKGISALDANGDGLADNGCQYCQDLIWFDDPEFRKTGLEWLENHADECQSAGYNPDNSSDGQKGAPYGH